MEKELTYREAWEEIKKQIGSATYIRNDLGAPQITTMLIKDTGLFEIIERAFKRLEFLEMENESFIFFFSGGREAGKTAFTMSICNRLKALEIIKEKRVNVANFIYWLKRKPRTYRDYCQDFYQEQWYLHYKDNNDDRCKFYKLTEEEYDLLKEVICDDSGTIKTEAR